MSSNTVSDSEHSSGVPTDNLVVDTYQVENGASTQEGTMDLLLQKLDNEITSTDTAPEEGNDDAFAKRQLAGVNPISNEDSEKGVEIESTSEVCHNVGDFDEGQDRETSQEEDFSNELIGEKTLEQAVLETAWVKRRNVDKPVVYRRMISSESETSSGIAEEGQEQEQELTHKELRERTITDTAERLAHIFDDKNTSNPNLPALKNLLNSADAYALEEVDETKEKVVFTIESTKPLFPDNNLEEKLIEVEVDENLENDENEAMQTVAPVDTSKLPIVSSISINTFLDNGAPTRMSSGSSIEEVEEELNTTRIKDQYNLLSSENNPELPQLPELSAQDYRITSIQNIRNKSSSRIFSVATTADIYQSAKEFETKSNIATDDLSDDESVEDLKILVDYQLPILPTLSTFQVNPNSLASSSSMETVKMGKIATNRRTNEEYADISAENVSQHTFLSPKKEGKENEFSDVSQPEELVQKNQQQGNASEQENADESCTSANEFSGQGICLELPDVSRSSALSTIFNDDLFNDQDFSFDEIDMTRKPKDNNYLSIWHSQEVHIRNVSPAVSSNSQFSTHSQPSSTTTAQSCNSSRFKSRVISRSQIRHSSYFNNAVEEYTLDANTDSKLDPMRRNTLLSRRIQQEIKMHERLHPLGSSLVGVQPEEQSVDYDIEASMKLKPYILDEEIEIKNSLPDFETLEPDFSSFIEKLAEDKDNKEDVLLSTRRQSDSRVLHGWSPELRNTSSIDENNAVNERMIAKILENVDEDITIGQIHAQHLNVIVGHGSNGIEASRSVSSFSSKSTKQTPLKHVQSPFKAVQTQQAMGSPSIFTHSPNSNKLAFNQGLALEKARPIKVPQDHNIHIPSQELQDKGRLFIKLRKTSSLALQGIRSHHAKYSVEFDNGKEVIETPWEPIPEDGSITLNKEMEIILDSSTSTLTITIKLQYKSPETELVEVVDRIPIKKKFPFTKSKYRIERRYDTKKVACDEWDYLFAKDGSYARCKIELNASKLKKMEYCEKSTSMQMVNEWARNFDRTKSNRPTNIWELPRISPHSVCNLEFDILYLPRVSQLERFPKSLEAVRKCHEKYMEQQSITKEGYLWQEGGDIDGLMKKRYYKLKGTDLIAHEAVTQKPITLLNLLNVIDIYVDGKSISGKQIRNFTDVVLLNDCFKLFFSNDEIVNFNADSKVLKKEWVEALSKVVQLNKFHQPWIKKLISEQKD